MCTHLPLVYRKSQAELREQIDQLSEGNVLIQGPHDYEFEWGTTTLHGWLGAGVGVYPLTQMVCTD